MARQSKLKKEVRHKYEIVVNDWHAEVLLMMLYIKVFLMIENLKNGSALICLDVSIQQHQKNAMRIWWQSYQYVS